MQEPKESHGAALEQVLRYLHDTTSFGHVMDKLNVKD